MGISKACYIFVATLAVYGTGCVTAGIKKIDSDFSTDERKLRKATIVNYIGLHPPRGRSFGVAGVLAAAAVQDQQRGRYIEELNSKCIQSIDEELAPNTALPYLTRSSLGISGAGPVEEKRLPIYTDLKLNHGVTAMITVRLNFGIKTGFKKRVFLFVNWEVFSPDGHSELAIDTEEIADFADETFPDTDDPRYENTFVELARRSAESFLHLLES